MLFSKKDWLTLSIAPDSSTPDDAILTLNKDADDQSLSVFANPMLLAEYPLKPIMLALAGACEVLKGVDGDMVAPPPHANLRVTHSRRKPDLDDGVLCVLQMNARRHRQNGIRMVLHGDPREPELLMIRQLCQLFLMALTHGRPAEVK